MLTYCFGRSPTAPGPGPCSARHDLFVAQQVEIPRIERVYLFRARRKAFKRCAVPPVTLSKAVFPYFVSLASGCTVLMRTGISLRPAIMDMQSLCRPLSIEIRFPRPIFIVG